MPEQFSETSTGLLMVANGHDPVLRWDGLKASMEEAGMDAPSSGVTLAGTGNGAIVGTYYAYLRWVDDLGNVSNLSPISAAFEPAGDTGTITGASNATPIVITSTSHGLATGDTVKIEGVGGNTSANNTWTITVVDANSFSLDDSTGTAVYTGGGTWTSGIQTITYSNVEAPSDPKVARRQILRNTDGQTQTFYVDVDTEDLSATSFQSTNSDTTLAAQTAQAILDTDGTALANRHTKPPNNKSVIVSHKGRMFMAVDREYSGGSCQVTFGSTTVTGIGTEWTSSMAGRFLYVIGAQRSYEISSVDAVSQTLTLLTAYLDNTDKFAEYAIRPAPAERRLIYYSEANLPESWPATNAVELQEDNDYLTGLMPKGSFLYILENRHIYRWTFNANPEEDGGIFLSSNRGCVNQRCWAVVDNSAYLLDEEGIYRFGGDEGFEPSSEPIADLFSVSDSVSEWRVNWQARELFHCLHFPPDTTIRWFVCLTGQWFPRHAICYNYRDNRFWLEEYSFPIPASCVSYIRNKPVMLLGGPDRSVYYLGGNTLDGPSAKGGTIQGSVSSATQTSITDSTAQFGSDLVGTPIGIRYGKGVGQWRIVTEVSGTSIKVDQPWIDIPDETSKYQLGAIRWHFRSQWFRFLNTDNKESQRRLELTFEPLGKNRLQVSFARTRNADDFTATYQQVCDVHFYTDFTGLTELAGRTQAAADSEGLETTKGNSRFICDLTKYNGIVEIRMPGARTMYADGRRWTQFELSGFGGQEAMRIYEIGYDGVM